MNVELTNLRNPIHTSRRAVILCLAACASLTAQAGAPVDAEPPAVTAATGALNGIHHQALLGGALVSGDPAQPGDIVSVFLPRPPFESWEAVELTADDGCLTPGALHDPGPGYVLVQEVGVPGLDGDGLLPGETCSTIVRATFHGAKDGAEDAVWQAAVAVRLHRPEAPPFPDDTLAAHVTFSRIQAAPPAEGHGRTPGPATPPPRVLLVEITVANHGDTPLMLLGLADPESLTAASGAVHRLPEGVYVGTVAELRKLGGPTSDVPLEPGESARLGLVLDAEGTLAGTLGTLSVQPSILVRRADDTFSFRLSRVSTTWGEALP